MVGRGTKISEGADVGVGTVKKGYKFLIGDGGTAGKKKGQKGSDLWIKGAIDRRD